MSWPSIRMRPPLDIVEPLQQRQHGGFAGAGISRPGRRAGPARSSDRSPAAPARGRDRRSDIRRTSPRPARARSGLASGRSGSSCSISSAPIASSSRATCCVRSTSATARSRVPCRMPSDSEVISTMSPTVAWPCCHSSRSPGDHAGHQHRGEHGMDQPQLLQIIRLRRRARHFDADGAADAASARGTSRRTRAPRRSCR